MTTKATKAKATKATETKATAKTVKKQNKITKKQMKKAKKGLLDLLGGLNQVLKQFGGLYDRVLPETGGMTVAAYMEQLGVTRSNGKNYRPCDVFKAIADELKVSDGKSTTVYVYHENSVVIDYSDPNDENGSAYRCYASKETAIAPDGKPLKVYDKRVIDSTKWSCNLLLKVLEQSREIEKHVAKSEKSKAALSELESVWILLDSTRNGEKVQTPKKVSVKTTSTVQEAA